MTNDQSNTTDLFNALEEMEFAQDGVTMLMPREVYPAMIAVPGMSEALLRLDNARNRARSLTMEMRRAMGVALAETSYPG